MGLDEIMEEVGKADPKMKIAADLLKAISNLSESYVLGIMAASLAGGRETNLPPDLQEKINQESVIRAKRLLELAAELKGKAEVGSGQKTT